MNKCATGVLAAGLVLTLAVFRPAAVPAAAESTRVLLGTWSGKATGPQGGPPTGDLVVTFEKDPPSGIKGKILVKAQGGMQYTGQVSNIALKSRMFSATAVFKLGEIPLEVIVTGPLKGKMIEGTFTVVSKGQIMGEGTFSIAKETAGKART